ncbi:hypothetical protein NPX13_g6466 [Xylaria arbuscula]|uniref:Uncharacterized protein n=1 Tax=Xylaria arbuscula TaxID=114810 RepID=A0A9W8TKD7_9PEZI|nr:hypothetical protein NPX13_g6466 [Xylaria arbuscula]
MGLTTFTSFLALVLRATAAPAQQDDTPPNVECFGLKPVAMFNAWNTECNVGSGRGLGMQIAMPAWEKLCRPLPEDTHGLEITDLAPGCHIQAFRGAVCQDYPNNRLFKTDLGCLWTGGDIYKSFMVTCDNKTIDELVGNDYVPLF